MNHYKNLIFLPIDIDLKDIDNFNTEAQSIETFGGLWKTSFIGDEVYDNPVLKYISEQLPFQKITMGKYNTQNNCIPSHIDVQKSYVNDDIEYYHITSMEPAGYRIVISGHRDALEVYDGKNWITAYLPKTPFAYVLNSTTAYHRVEGEIGRTTMYFRGILDEEKHSKLLENNLTKFKDYAIFDSTTK